MWELDCEESWVPKNWWFWSVVLEKTPESPLDCKEIQPVHPKGDQSWVFIGRTDVEAKTSILWPTDVKSWLIWRPWCLERLRAEGEGDDRGWDGWMASTPCWTGVWVNSESWWWTGRPDMPRLMGSQRVRHNWVTELNRTKKFLQISCVLFSHFPLYPFLYSDFMWGRNKLRFFHSSCYCVCLHTELLHSCQILCTHVHGILQARILEWVAMPSSRESSQPRDRTASSMAPLLQLNQPGSPHVIVQFVNYNWASL